MLIERAQRPPGQRSVLVYRRQFLPISETFIVDHIKTLNRWRPVVACDRILDRGLDVAGLYPTPIYSDKDGRLSRWRMQFAGQNATLQSLATQQGVDLIHAHFLTDGARIAEFARRRRIPLLVTAHGYDATLWPAEQMKTGDGRFLRLMRGRLISAAAAVICVSDFIRNELELRGFPSEKLITLRLGVDLDSLKIGPPITSRRGVLFAGRLVEKKGLSYLLRAWAKLPSELQSTPLNVIGEGPLRADMEALAKSLGVRAQFLGAQPRSEVLRLMAASRVFVFPSVRAPSGDAEGMGVVAMEAQAQGTPVIAFNGGPAPEAIADDRSGLLAIDRDVDSLSQCIKTLLVDDQLAERLSLGGPGVARERFDLNVNYAALEDLYDRVFARRELRTA